MALYLVSYDIADKDRDEYEDLWAKLKELKATKILYSEWVVIRKYDPNGNTAHEIYKALSPLISSSGRTIDCSSRRWPAAPLGTNCSLAMRHSSPLSRQMRGSEVRPVVLYLTCRPRFVCFQQLACCTKPVDIITSIFREA
jgi:hypothetical protein